MTDLSAAAVASPAHRTPESVAPPPRHVRFPLVDGMRALAVLCTVIVHCAPFAGVTAIGVWGRLLDHLNIGVTVFFLISGFLLYRPFIAHRAGGAPPPRLGAYLRRRALRILPAYWLVLTVLLLVPGMPDANFAHVWPMYSLLQAVPFYGTAQVCSANVGCGLAQTWSLFAEVTFYATLPLYVLVTEWLTRRLALRAWLVVQGLMLGGLSAVSVAVTSLASPSATVTWSVIGNVYWFACGMTLAIVSAVTFGTPLGERLDRWMGRWGTALWAGAVAAYVVLSMWLPPTAFVLGTGQRLVNQLAFGVIALVLLAPIVLGRQRRGLPHRLLGTRVVAWFGLVSYGVFLWHYAFVLLLGPVHGSGAFLRLLAGTLALTTVCAAVSYYALEAPVMRFK